MVAPKLQELARRTPVIVVVPLVLVFDRVGVHA